MSKLMVGIQVYSVREDAQNDFLGTIKKLKEIGYDFVELAGLYGRTKEEVKADLDEAGISALSAHVSLMEFIKDAEETAKTYKYIGCRYVAIPNLSQEYRAEAGNFERTIEAIKKAAQACKAEGIQLLYHNHDFEFFKMGDGSYCLDYIYDSISAELLQTEIDICWVKVAGEIPAEYIKKYSGRSPVIHLKDFVGSKAEGMYELIGDDSAQQKDSNKFKFRPVGHGSQNIPAVLSAAVESGAEMVVVEQDKSYEITALDAAKISREYLRSVEY